MVTMKWTLDEQGRAVSAWQAEAPTTTQAKVFGTRYHKAMRQTTTARVPMRRHSLRTLAALATTTIMK